MKSNLPQHPCNGKCSNYIEERCDTCLILDPVCDYCGSDQLVVRTNSNDGFVCTDCIDDLELVADISKHMTRAVAAQGEIS